MNDVAHMQYDATHFRVGGTVGGVIAWQAEGRSGGNMFVSENVPENVRAPVDS